MSHPQKSTAARDGSAKQMPLRCLLAFGVFTAIGLPWWWVSVTEYERGSRAIAARSQLN